MIKRPARKRHAPKTVNISYSIAHDQESVGPYVPTFNRCADNVLSEAKSIYEQRNDEYQDNLAEWNLVTTFTEHTLRAIAKKSGDEAVRTALTKKELRLIQIASLIDIKDGRMLGNFKRDTVIDGINYRAVWTQLMDEYLTGQ